MLRFGSLIVLCVVAMLAIQGCSKKHEDCPFLAPQMIIVGYTEDQSDTLIIRQYAKNTNFATLIDTLKVTRAHINREAIGKDSQRLKVDNYPLLYSDFYLHDWQIYFPGVDRTINITDATPQFTQEKEASAQCQSYVKSVNFDGRSYEFTTWFDVAYRVYSKK